MGTVMRISLFVIYFIAFTSHLHQDTDALSLMNMFMSGAINKKVTTLPPNPIEDDYEVEDLEDDDSDEADTEDGHSGLLAMLNSYMALRRPNRPTDGHSKPGNHKPDIVAAHNLYDGKPTIIVTKTLVHEVTRRVTVHPVCVTAYGNKSPCIADDDQHPTHSHPHGDLKDHENGYGNMETEYSISEPEYATDFDSAYLQPSEFSIYGLSDTDKEDILIDSRAARYLKMYTQTPTFVNKHPTILSDQIDEDGETEKWFHHAVKRTVTKTILATKIQRIPNLQVTATLVAQNCIPASYLSHPWCKTNPDRTTEDVQGDDTFDLDIRKYEEGVIEEIDLSKIEDVSKNISVNKSTPSVEDVDGIDLKHPDLATEILLSELVPNTILSKEDDLRTTKREDEISFDAFNPDILLEEHDPAPIQIANSEENTNSEESTENTDEDEAIPKIEVKNSKNSSINENSESTSGKGVLENLNTDDGDEFIKFDSSSADNITEIKNTTDLTTESS